MTRPHHLPASFDADPGVVETGPAGQLAHRDLISHTALLEPNLYRITDGVWCVVGNGLSNQTFVEGPDGLIVVDTGECIEEMAAAMAMVREETGAPIAAVVYTHFHYVAGTRALAGEVELDDVPIWGHELIPVNRSRATSEIAAAYARGLVHQFGVMLPVDGPDAVVNVGLGLHYRNPAHAPFTHGYVPPTRTFAEPTTATIAGLAVELTPAPSDADDSITIWFPEQRVCVNNLVWPALFNVFAIRGEEYRDPRVLLRGLDHVRELAPDHLIGAHGPPISGRDRIADEVTRYRDSIQFMWDQTVRGINRGLVSDELTEFVQLPARFHESSLTRQFYGVVEHHVRQIHNGLRGWFDGDEAQLFPLPPTERARRLVDGFGGADAVRARFDTALAADDLRWALELASWLVRVDEQSAPDRDRLAAALRAIAQRTTSSNVRNWCLTRAQELEGKLDLSRFRGHRFGRREVLAGPFATYVHTLRVLLDPTAADGVTGSVAFALPDGTTAGLDMRNCVAVPTDGADAEVTIELDRETFADVLSGRTMLADAVDAGAATIRGDDGRLRELLGCFDLAALHVP